jgi:hypothetical protein
MKYSGLLIISILLFAAWGCKNTIEDKNTQQIDSAIAVIEGAQQAINALDSAEVARLNKVYDAYNTFFVEEYTDVNNREFYTGPLSELADCRKRLIRTAMAFQGWKKELERVHEQLSTLRHDYANQLIEKEDFEKYLSTEMATAEKINSEVTKNVGLVSMCMRNHKALSTKLDSARAAWLAQNQE